MDGFGRQLKDEEGAPLHVEFRVEYDKATMKGLFVTDLDGTLLTTEKTISAEDAASLSRLRQSGIVTVAATGRSEYSFDRLAAELERRLQDRLPFDYIIFSTGAGVMDYPERNLLKNVWLSSEEVEHICLRLKDRKLDYMVHRSIPHTRYFAYSTGSRQNPDFQKRLAMYREFGVPLTRTSLAEIGNATEILCISPAGTGHRIAEDLGEEMAQFSVVKATSPLDGESIWIEIFQSAVSKSNAVIWLADELMISRGNVCAVGNDYNDVDLLEWAGCSYVVGNAPDSLKSRFIPVASNDTGGVSQAVWAWLTHRGEVNIFF